MSLWDKTTRRFAFSRAEILLCHEVRHHLVGVEVPDSYLARYGEAAADWLAHAMPERHGLDLNITNLLSENPPFLERAPIGTTDQADEDADELEAWSNSAMEDDTPYEDLIGKGAEDAQYGLVVLPTSLDYYYAPDYLIKDGELEIPDSVYDRDERGRYGAARSERQSAKAHEEALRAYLADHLGWTVRILPALDCVPLLVRGRGRRRWEVRGLMTRSLFDREDLLERGYGWKGSDRVDMIPRGFDARNTYGNDGQVYLYEAFLTLRDKDGTVRPTVAYCVGGAATWSERDRRPAESDPVVVRDLRDEFGLDWAPWTYEWGMHHNSDDPDFYGVPFIRPLCEAILNYEGFMTARLGHEWGTGYPGMFHTPDPILAEKFPSAIVESGGDLRRPKFPKSGEIETSTGPITPAIPPQVSPGVQYLEQSLLGAIRENTPQPEQGSPSASGHALVISHALLQSAKRQIREGARRSVEFIAEARNRIACAYIRRFKVEPCVWVTEELPVDTDGDRAERTTSVSLKERWLGRNYRMRATFPDEFNLAMVSLMADLEQKGLATDEDVDRARGLRYTRTERIKRAAYRQMQSEAGQLQLEIDVAKWRGELEQAQRLELIQQERLTKLGMPTAAVAMPPEPPGMPGVGVGNPADASRVAAVAGEVGQAATANDARALAEMGLGGASVPGQGPA
jgi:hypothetical protein